MSLLCSSHRALAYCSDISVRYLIQLSMKSIAQLAELHKAIARNNSYSATGSGIAGEYLAHDMKADDLFNHPASAKNVFNRSTLVVIFAPG